LTLHVLLCRLLEQVVCFAALDYSDRRLIVVDHSRQRVRKELMVFLYEFLILNVELLLGSIVLFVALLGGASVDALDPVKELRDLKLAELH